MKPSLSTETQTTYRKSECWRNPHSLCLPTMQRCCTMTASCGRSVSLSLNASSLFDNASKVTAKNGALSKRIHGQGMDSQWRSSESRLCEATQLPPPAVLYQTSAIHRHKLINVAFVLAWHHCCVFIKMQLHHRCFLFIQQPRCSLLFVPNNDAHLWKANTHTHTLTLHMQFALQRITELYGHFILLETFGS